MAKFCTKCGKPLEEGEVCSCTQAAPQQQAAPQMQAAPQQQAPQQQGYVSNEQQFQQTQQAVAGFLTRMFGAFINVIKHPVTAGRDMILKGDYAVAIALIVLQGIVTCIFGAVTAKDVSIIHTILDGYSSLFSSYDAEVSYGKVIFGTLFISILLSFVLAGLLFLANMIIKNALNFKQILSAVAIRSCVASIATLVALVFFFINPFIGATLFVSGTVWGFFIILLAMPLSGENLRDKLPLTMILVFFIFACITGFSMYQGLNLYAV